MKTKQQFTIKNSQSGVRAYRNFAVGLFTFLAAYLVASLLAPVHNSSAETQLLAANVTNTDAGVSITPGKETIELNVGQPDPNGSFIAASDTLTAKSTATHGYQLYVSMANNHTNGNRLYLDGDETSGFIAPNHDEEGNTIVYPSTAAVARNAWGFTTSEEDNDNEVFGALPLMGNEYQIASRETPTSLDGEPIQVYYAVNVDTNMVSGTYTGNVLYTIIAEIDNADLGTPSITPQSAYYGDTVTISVPLKSTVANTEDLGTVTAKIGNDTCNITDMILGGATVNISCAVPDLTTAGNYNVEVYIQKYGSTFMAENAFSYIVSYIDITYMQEMTTAMCDHIPDNQIDATFNLTDARDGKPYKIVKHKDNNCWMQQNLALDGMDSDGNVRTLTPADSNVTQDRPLAKNISSGAASKTDIQIFSGVSNNYTSNCGSYAYCVTNTEKYGNHYNWIAATAGVGNATMANETVEESVCPSAGNGETWRLPDKGDSTGVKSFANLVSSYGILPTDATNNKADVRTIQQNPLYFTLAGLYQGSMGSITFYGNYWSRAAAGAPHAYHLLINSSAGVYRPDHASDRSNGLSLRCVLGE